MESMKNLRCTHTPTHPYTHTMTSPRLLLLLPALAAAALASAGHSQGSPLIGRWDVTVQDGRSTYPSWFEVKRSGHKTLVGSYVARGGSARPIAQVHFAEGKTRFAVPVQWESGPEEIRFEGQLEGDRLSGTIKDDNGKEQRWTAVRAPSLKREGEPRWAQPVELFNGQDLSGWKARSGSRHGWTVQSGILKNAKPGMDLISERTFNDFKVHAEFRYPKGSNSGLYLRGRYEAQIEDNYGREPESHLIGGIYGFLTPRVNAGKPAGEWQTYDITLVGRRITVTLNGETVIDRQEIPGITGGALDSNEGEPGPIMLQGDHGPVEFRKITVTPAS